MASSLKIWSKAIWHLLFGGLALLMIWILGFIFILGLFFYTFEIPKEKNLRRCFITELHHLEICPQEKSFITLGQIPSYVQWAVIVSEDGSFYNHKGLDWFELQASVEKNLAKRELARGGSTISQQLIKNIYLSKDKTFSRKIKEALLTTELENSYKKNEILELYFNIAEFGPQIFGILKASAYFFGKHPSMLSPAEGVYLATLLPNPEHFGKSKVTGRLTPFHLTKMKAALVRLLANGKIKSEQESQAQQRIDANFWGSIDMDYKPVMSASDEVNPLESGDGPVREEDGQEDQNSNIQ